MSHDWKIVASEESASRMNQFNHSGDHLKRLTKRADEMPQDKSRWKASFRINYIRRLIVLHRIQLGKLFQKNQVDWAKGSGSNWNSLQLSTHPSSLTMIIIIICSATEKLIKATEIGTLRALVTNEKCCDDIGLFRGDRLAVRFVHFEIIICYMYQTIRIHTSHVCNTMRSRVFRIFLDTRNIKIADIFESSLASRFPL